MAVRKGEEGGCDRFYSKFCDRGDQHGVSQVSNARSITVVTCHDS